MRVSYMQCSCCSFETVCGCLVFAARCPVCEAELAIDFVDISKEVSV